eukprot:TRINITY_DN3192_c0_g1_i1.p1 TRINITY_DN3192_c0_g1~~TRINITY_DN3192_c0_g1_i1.p1  ORF type:complete len:593 (+),score=160.60 TRINITY_DN3192_c0_g1_i1:55-1779(+)
MAAARAAPAATAAAPAAADSAGQGLAAWEGRLEKKAGGGKVMLNEWATRWFQLRGDSLVYYEEKGRVDLRAGCKVSVRAEDGDTGFLLEARGKRPLQLRAPTSGERDGWVEHLGQAGALASASRIRRLEEAEAAGRDGVAADALSSCSSVLAEMAAAAGVLAARLQTTIQEMADEYEDQVDELRAETAEIASWAAVPGLHSMLSRLSLRALDAKPDSHQDLAKCLRQSLEAETQAAPGGALATKFRGWVSMNKQRFSEDGYDLDLTYITPRIIAMGFPSHGAEGWYRNPVDQVERFFESRHRGHFKVYNLCSERHYDRETRFGRNYQRFPFDDHNAPAPISIMYQFVDSAKRFLDANPKNVIAVHCKAGKGRTGVMVCAYLMATGGFPKADAVLTEFASARTNDGVGVSIPSQIRYVGYFERSLGQRPPGRRLRLDRLMVKGSKPGSGTPWDLYVKVQLTPAERGGAQELFDSRKQRCKVGRRDDEFLFDLGESQIMIDGDVRVAFYAARRLRSDDHMFHFWVHTHFVTPGCVHFSKQQLDKAVKDTKHQFFSSNLSVDAWFSDAQQSLEAGCV